MRYIDIELSEVDLIQILNALSYFRNEIVWHESLNQKRRIAMYFNFTDPEEYAEQYNLLDNLHKLLSLQANRKMYKIVNNYYFEGQRIYLSEGKNYKQIVRNNNYSPKKIKLFFEKSIDKLKKIV